MNDTIRQIADWIARSEHFVVFTGAGISTESGIPDFRSPGGVWARYQPVYFDDFLASAAARHEYWRQKCEAHDDFSRAEPNTGHRTLAQWEAEGRLQAIITQNIDGLHQIAGNRQVAELHGTAREVACLDCGARFPVEPLVEFFQQAGRVPDCRNCQGRLKHATVSFGQMLPEDILEQAMRWSRQADLMFALGSSLVVTPAADLPRIACQSGARLVIINRDETGLDSMADYVLHESIGETLSAINQQLASNKRLP